MNEIQARLFSDRFEPAGDGYIFRSKLTAPGYAVSAAERDQFVADHARRSRWATWGLAGLMTVALLLGATVFIASGRDVPTLYIGGVVLGSVLLAFVVTRWIWSAPARCLHGRAPVAPGLGKIEARREGLRRLSWQNLGLAVGVAAFVLFRGYREDPTFSGWHGLWLVASGGLLLLAAVQAFRKWRSAK